jgi:hypothetical protein
MRTSVQGAAPRDGQEAREGAGGVIERDDEEAALPRAGAERERRLGEIGSHRAMGHKNINSTMAYLSFVEDEIDQAILAS